MVDIEKGLSGEVFDTDRVKALCHEFDVASLSLFGSFSRDEASPSSDIDLIVEFNSPKSLLTIISLQNELSKELGREVDLLTRDSLSPYIRDKITKETKPIYVKG